MTKGRICVVCELRLKDGKWMAHEFPAACEELGFKGKWAHVGCLVQTYKYRDARRKLLGYREES